MSKTLIDKLLDKRVYPHAVDELQLVETHISWVIIAGDYVYKIKKPVDFGFLDFSTLDKRKKYCEEELRLNQRFAQSLYLSVIGIKQTEQAVELDCDQNEADEYAVKMRRFDPASQFDHLLERGELSESLMLALADEVFAFHQIADVATDKDVYGTAVSVYGPVAENFSQIEPFAEDPDEKQLIHEIKAWSEDKHASLTSMFNQRKKNGFVRECHGDLHLQNIAIWNDQPLMFDCIEFNPGFRWIDTINEIAFLVMDLHYRKQFQLAQVFINRYLESSGDYQGMMLFRFYLCYRAMVRAKVARLRLSQPMPDSEKKQVRSDYQQHLQLAHSYTRSVKPALILMYGLSGSGKTTVARELVKKIPGILIRSDVERKRLFQDSPVDLYSTSTSIKTYEHLLQQAQLLLQADYHAIVDATFQKRSYRKMFLDYAMQNKIPVYILNCVADYKVLKQRLIQRQAKGKDASDADVRVLDMQIENWAGLEESENKYVVTVETENESCIEDTVNALGLDEQH